MKKGYYAFTLILQGFEQLTSSVEDALYEAGCDDAVLSVGNGISSLEFDREAESFEGAVLSAIQNVASSGVATVVRVESEDLVYVDDIAEKTDRSRQNIHQLIKGERGPGGFPPPVNPRGRRHLWRWSEVAPWMQQHTSTIIEGPSKVERQIRSINAALELHATANADELQRITTPRQTKFS